jgi:hypothetical protein
MLPPTFPPGPPQFVWAQEQVFLGSRTLPFGGPTVSGAAFAPVSVNLGGESVFRFTVSAPEGYQYRVNVPAGIVGVFSFNVHLGVANAPGVTLVPPGSVGFEIDGVAQAILSQPAGVDPAGEAILLEGTEQFGHAAPFTFRTLTMSLAYGVDSNGTPIPVADAARVWGGLSDAYVSFGSGSAAELGAPSAYITMEAVPEPGTAGLLVAGVMGVFGRRRRSR